MALPRTSTIKPGFLSGGTFRPIYGSFESTPGDRSNSAPGSIATLESTTKESGSKERTPSFLLRMKVA